MPTPQRGDPGPGGRADHSDSASSSPVHERAFDLLRMHLRGALAHRGRGLVEEYDTLEAANHVGAPTAAAEAQPRKNRYCNVLPYDDTRYALPGGAYINASRVGTAPGTPGGPWEYVCTQGPLPSTVPDFWAMVLALRCPVIVMLTNVREKGTTKCAPYFPTGEGAVMDGGTATVAVQRRDTLSGGDIVLHTLHVTPTASAAPGEDTAGAQGPLTVLHVHYTTWPDHGVPESTEGLRALVRYLADAGLTRGRVGDWPIVHCSAGIGRTGTFCAVDTVLRSLDALAAGSEASNGSFPSDAAICAAISLPSVVRCLREQRRGMVQTLDQFHFCYAAVHDELEARVGRA